MKRALSVALGLWAVLALGACTGDSRATSPASPSSLPATADTFVGAWTSATAGASSPIAACSRFEYAVDKASERTVNLKVAATCAGVTLDAIGNGTLAASSLSWDAHGTATGPSGTGCAFSFADSSATPLSDGTIRIDYKGKVCGVPVSGSEIVRKM
jgi:hypothetical protein